MTTLLHKAVALFRVLPLVGFVLAWGCSHEDKSPAVTLTRLEPNLICNDQFDAGGVPVEIRGDGFTPMPFDVIAEPAQAELPTVLFERTRNLDGSSASGSVQFSGEPDGTNADDLGWTSKQLMTVTFNADNAPEAGLYRVTVTNPDDERKASLPVGLAVVPPPRVESVVPTVICDPAQAQQITVAGEGFIEIDGERPTVQLTAGAETQTFVADAASDCTELMGISPTVNTCRTLTVTVPADALAPGDYNVVVVNPRSARCSSTDQVTLRVKDTPVLFFADPPSVYNGINTRVTLYMTEVTDMVTVEISPTGATEPRTQLDAARVPDKNRIQATVPEGQPVGTYDVTVTDSDGCISTLEAGIVVVGELTLTLTSITPPFGDSTESTSVQITGAGFAPTPRAFLNPSGTGDAVQLESVTFVDADTLNAVVPENTPVGIYDLVVVNPDGSVGLLPNAFESLGVPPPVVVDVVPQSIVSQTGETISIVGTGFSASSVGLMCVDAAGTALPAPTVTSGTETCDATTGQCTLTATVGTALPLGSVCVVRVTNGDPTNPLSPYSDFSAIAVTNNSFNLQDPSAGQSLLMARRALGSAAVKAAASQRFVYAIGGDDGAGTVYNSVEFAPVDLFGRMSPFILNRTTLGTARAFLGTTTVGRYVYAIGGTDGATALASAERALVLSPEEIPHIEDLDLCLSGGRLPCYEDPALGTGLSAGTYSYRVAAVITPGDPENIGGETLASDPIIMKLPSFDPRRILVQLTWSAPVDALGAELTGIESWRIYRTPVDGQPGRDELLLAEIPDDPAARVFIDDGTLTPGGDAPLPVGSLSAWGALPPLSVGREGVAAASAFDPANRPEPLDPSGTGYVYALLGRDGGTAHTTYDFLTLDIQPNARQVVMDTTAWATGAQESAVGRWQHGAWTVDSVVSEVLAQSAPTDTWLYVGAGLLANGTTQDGTVEAGRVTAGGELESFVSVNGFASTRVGYGTAAAANRLFAFGGLSAQVTQNAIAALIEGPMPTLAANAWNNEGLQMTVPRYLMGSSIQSAFIFLIGGTGPTGTGATTSTETVVW